MIFALRRTWPDDAGRPDDYVIRHAGRDIGRLYRGTFARDQAWRWTIYMDGKVRRVDGVPIEGLAAALDQAKAEFRKSFERMVSFEH